MTETLFSLEVHVESVEELRMTCKLPALCFRLLDFPTMIIHHVSPVDAEKMRQRLHMEDRESLLHELKDRFGNFQFRKGKSCLFKTSIDTLLIQLQTVPLYAMLMDLWPKKPILVGSTLIPLKTAIDKISADVYDKGVAVPAFFRDEGDFAVYNLMGSPIAKVRLGFRLLSLGGSLIPHIPTEALGNRVSEKVQTSEKVEQPVKDALQKVLPEIESKDFSEKEPTSERENIAENVTSTQKPKIQHVEVQTNLHAKTIKSSGMLNRQRRDSKEDIVITNTFCPPPLYYNYFSKSTPSGRSHFAAAEEGTQQSSSSDDGMRCGPSLGQDENDEVDFVYYDPGVLETDGTVGMASVSVQTDEILLRPSSGPRSNRGQAELINGLYNLRSVSSDSHLPILNALLQELSCLTGGQQVRDTTQARSRSGQSQVTPRHPQIVGDRKPPPADRNSRSVSKSQTHTNQARQAPPGKKTQTSVIGLPRQRVRFKQTSLTYGMTRTQKMRLEINQRAKLPNRTRPCETQRALTQKENVTRDLIQTPSSKGDLGLTYKINTAGKPQEKQVHKQTTDVQVQTQQLAPEQPRHIIIESAGTKEVMEANITESDPEVIPSTVESDRSVKSHNNLEVFIPQVEGIAPFFYQCLRQSNLYLIWYTGIIGNYTNTSNLQIIIEKTNNKLLIL